MWRKIEKMVKKVTFLVKKVRKLSFLRLFPREELKKEVFFVFGENACRVRSMATIVNSMGHIDRVTLGKRS